MFENQQLPGDSPDTDFRETDDLRNDILRHIRFTLGKDTFRPDKYACFMGLAYSVRDRLIDRWLPRPRILHPYPEQRLRVTTRGRSPVR